MRYKYAVYGKEKNRDTGIHPISIHTNIIAACFSLIFSLRHFTHLYIT